MKTVSGTNPFAVVTPMQVFQMLQDAPELKEIELSPQNVAKLREECMEDYKHVPTALIVGREVWTRMIGDKGFHYLIDPVTKTETLEYGKYGAMIGLDIIGCAYMDPQRMIDLKVRQHHPLYIAVVSVRDGQIKSIAQALIKE